MKSKITVFCIVIFLSNIVCGIAVAAPSLCAPTETVIFSCATTASKIISLCVDERDKLISYRYGKLRRVEMSYSARVGGENGFYANHYFRPSVDYTRISFAVAEYQYSVFKNYDATEEPAIKYGVAVSKNGDNETQIECHSRVADNMKKILKDLKCDRSSALGCP
ncbi:hypothetical protein [Paraburkholderia sp. J41]|uniref:hypothetical protein n=1 Tax=Paraburkholderia sp. J41 TaxID=2805433 RepID=UPI002AC35C0E|nr:hypothetical protein [Paraburkholderia sp. J41]